MDQLPDLISPHKTLFPEKNFAEALHDLWEVDEGTRSMSPEEARHLWECVKQHIDQYPVVKAMEAARIKFHQEEIDKTKKYLGRIDRYMIRAMRSAGLDAIEGQHYQAEIRQNVSYKVMDQPTLEDMVALPDCVETSLEWITPRPSASITNEIAMAFVDFHTDVVAFKRRVKELLFAPAKFEWAKLGNGHMAIHNLLKKNPKAIKNDRYTVTITDNLDVDRKKTNGRAKTKRATKTDDAPALPADAEREGIAGSQEP